MEQHIYNLVLGFKKAVFNAFSDSAGGTIDYLIITLEDTSSTSQSPVSSTEVSS